MSAPKATDQQSQDAEHQVPNLDRRYGKIGISAVAAAVRHRSEKQQQQQQASGHGFQYDSD